jgi:hypothetical protein
MHKILSTLALSTLFSFGFSSAHANPPMQPFYESVMKMTPTGKLGEVIKKEQITTPVKGAQAWRIAYISSDLMGRKTISTGLVVAPVGPAPKEGRSIMAWSHGTTGAAQNCGPSQILNPAVPLNEYFLVGGNSWTDYGIPSVEEFIKDGHVVVATDYQGQGSGGIHQYAVAATQSRDLINSVRAASSMQETGAGKRAVAYGWSQGGGSVLAAASLPDYISQTGTAADGIGFVGFVALAPYDMAAILPKGKIDQATADKIMGELQISFSTDILNFAHFSMGLYGMQSAYSNLKLTDILTDEGAKAIQAIYSNKCVHAAADTIVFAYGKEFSKLLKPKPTNTLAWIQAFIQGSVAPVNPVAPVVIYWGTKDTTQPPIQGKLYQVQKCQTGANVNRVQLPGAQSHFTTPGTAGPLYREWIKDRLAGKPATNNCAEAAQLPS